MTLQRKKEIGIVAFVVLYSLFYFLLLRLLLYREGWTLMFTMFALIGGLVWTPLVASSIAFLVNRTASGILLALLLAGTVFLGAPLSLTALIGALLVGGVIFAAHSSIRREMESRVSFTIRQIFRGGIRLLVLALIIALFTQAQPLFTNGSTNNTIRIRQEHVATVTKPFTPLLQRYIPGYTHKTTVDDIIEAQFQQQSANLPPGFTVPPSQKAQARQELSRQFGLELQGSETLPYIVSTLLNRYIEGTAGNSGLIVLIATIAIILLAFRLLTPLLVWPIIGLVAIIVDIAKRIGLISIVTSQVAIERVHL